MSSEHYIIKQVGARIRKERNAKLIKQETLAKKVRLSKSEISRIENGQREIKLSKLFEIAKAIDVNPIIFFDKEE